MDNSDLYTSQRFAERLYWRTLWLKAKDNVGSSTQVCRLLGYNIVSPNGNHHGNNRWYTNWVRGSKPKDERKQRLLHILASPHYKTLLRAIERLNEDGHG
jgi:hypothetical protein